MPKYSLGGCQLDELEHEVVWRLSLYAERLESRSWEILEVVGDNHLCTGSDRGSEDVSVILVGQVERIDELLISNNETVTHRTAHQIAGALQREEIDIGSVLKDAAHHLVEDLIGPASAKPIGASQSDQ